MCDLVQECLITCYRHNIILDLHCIKSAVNMLADAASRQLWKTFYDHAPTFWLFADTRAQRLKQQDDTKQKMNKDKSLPDVSMLPSRVQFSVGKYSNKAFEESTRTGARTAWSHWEKYIEECCNTKQVSIFMNPHSSAFKIYLTGFRAALADNLYGTDIKASSTVETYCQQIIWILKQRDNEAVNSAVSRRIKKQLQDGN